MLQSMFRQPASVLPPGPPYVLNADCRQAEGLVGWWPLGEPSPRAYQSYAGNQQQYQRLTMNGTMGVAQGPYGIDMGLAGSGRAASNTGSTSNWLSNANTPVVTAMPMTFACWFNPANITAVMNLIVIGNSGGNNYWALLFDGANGYGLGDNAIVVDTAGTGGNAVATTTTIAAASRWYHACGIFTSSTSRAVYLNGAGKGTGTFSALPSSTYHTDIGAYNAGTTFSPLNGAIAHVCIWNRALTDDEVAELYAPPTRWKLHYPGRMRTYSFLSHSLAGDEGALWYLPIEA